LKHKARSIERAFIETECQSEKAAEQERLAEPEEQEQQQEEQSGNPPEPLEVAWFGASAKFILHEFLVVKVVVGNAEVFRVVGAV
jgi:hypothetical protein